jgi:hypothetical protein
MIMKSSLNKPCLCIDEVEEILNRIILPATSGEFRWKVVAIRRLIIIISLIILAGTHRQWTPRNI